MKTTTLQPESKNHNTIQPFFSPKTIQPKLTIGQPNDKYEQQADAMANKVLQMPQSSTAPAVQTKCAKCEQEDQLQTKPLIHKMEGEEEETLQTKLKIQKMEGEEEEALQTKPLMLKGEEGRGVATQALSSQLNSTKSRGSALPKSTNSFMSQAFGSDFSKVKIHTGSDAIQMNQGLNARAFTHRSDIYFNKGQYSPESSSGKKLLAHELTHVVQQRTAPDIKRKSNYLSTVAKLSSKNFNQVGNRNYLQMYPGNKMTPPGDCSWQVYLGLRGSVETAKAVVSTLGACSIGDSCLFLATKIAAISAEIAARLTLDTNCFKGGDTGHRQQVQDKINMLNRCHRFFSKSNCPPKLITAMALVVEKARVVIAMAAFVATLAVIIAAIFVLVVAIIALVEVIVAILVSVAETAAISTAATAIITLLVLIRDNLTSKKSSEI